MKINDDLILGALISSWKKSLVLEYKRKKSAFVLAEFKSLLMLSDFPAHIHTEPLCCINESQFFWRPKFRIPSCVFTLWGTDSVLSEMTGYCEPIGIGLACQCVQDKQSRTKGTVGTGQHVVAGHASMSPPGNLTGFYWSSRGIHKRASVRTWMWGLASISLGKQYGNILSASLRERDLRMSTAQKQGLLFINMQFFKE